MGVFDPDTVAPARTGSDTFRRTANRLTADEPTGVTHVLVNGVPIRRDGVQLPLWDRASRNATGGPH